MPMLTAEERKLIEHYIRWMSTDPLNAYEEAANQFYKDTGLMAPGKDVPAAMGGQESGMRQGVWQVWLTERRQAEVAAVAKALEAMEWLEHEVLLQADVTREELEVCMAAPNHMPVVNHRSGALHKKLFDTEQMAHDNVKNAYHEGIEKAAAVVHQRAQNTRTSVDAGSANARVSELALTLALNEILALLPKENA